MYALGNYMSVEVHCCIGGKAVGEDIRRLDAGVQIVSGTPGRVFDMIKKVNSPKKSSDVFHSRYSILEKFKNP